MNENIFAVVMRRGVITSGVVKICANLSDWLLAFNASILHSSQRLSRPVNCHLVEDITDYIISDLFIKWNKRASYSNLISQG